MSPEHKRSKNLLFYGMIFIINLMIAWKLMYEIYITEEQFFIRFLTILLHVISVCFISMTELLEHKRIKLILNYQRFVLKKLTWVKLICIGIYYTLVVLWSLRPDIGGSSLLIYFVTTWCLQCDSTLLIRKPDGIYYIDKTGTEYQVESIVTSLNQEVILFGEITLNVVNQQGIKSSIPIKSRKAFSKEWLRQLDDFTKKPEY